MRSIPLRQNQIWTTTCIFVKLSFKSELKKAFIFKLTFAVSKIKPPVYFNHRPSPTVSRLELLNLTLVHSSCCFAADLVGVCSVCDSPYSAVLFSLCFAWIQYRSINLFFNTRKFHPSQNVPFSFAQIQELLNVDTIINVGPGQMDRCTFPFNSVQHCWIQHVTCLATMWNDVGWWWLMLDDIKWHLIAITFWIQQYCTLLTENVASVCLGL